MSDMSAAVRAFEVAGALFALCGLILAFPLIGRHIERSRQRRSAEAARSRWDTETASASLEDIVAANELEERQRWLLLGEHYFWKDPLGSHSLPIELDAATPLAGEVFDKLAAEHLLTGVGADVDYAWHDWDLDLELMMKDLVNA